MVPVTNMRYDVTRQLAVGGRGDAVYERKWISPHCFTFVRQSHHFLWHSRALPLVDLPPISAQPKVEILCSGTQHHCKKNIWCFLLFAPKFFVVFGQRCNKDCFVLQNVYNLVVAFELALEFVFELMLTFVFFLRGTAWIWVTGQGAEEVDFTEEATKHNLAGQRGPSHHTVSEYKKHRSRPQDRKHRSQAKTRKHNKA